MKYLELFGWEMVRGQGVNLSREVAQQVYDEAKSLTEALRDSQRHLLVGHSSIVHFGIAEPIATCTCELATQYRKNEKLLGVAADEASRGQK